MARKKKRNKEKKDKKSKATFKEKYEALKLSVKWTYRSSKGLTILIFLVTIFGGLLAIVEPYIFRVIIDKITLGANFSLVEKLGIGLMGILVVYGVSIIVSTLIQDLQSIIKKIHSQKLDKFVALNLMDKISSLDAVYFETPEYFNTLTTWT